MGPRWLPVAAVTLLASAIAWFNRGERVAIDLGIVRFYRAPLTIVLFAAFLAGMLSLLLMSLRQDRRLRDELLRMRLPPPEAPPLREPQPAAAEPNPGSGDVTAVMGAKPPPEAA